MSVPPKENQRPAPDPATEPSSQPKQRDPAFDYARGFGIVTVLVHHWSNNSLGLYTVRHGVNWLILSMVNRLTTYSVPLFLLVSCVLAARKLTQDPDPIRFYRSRLPGVLYPYLVWTGVFWLLNLIANPSARHLIHGVPAFFTHPMARVSDLFWGKASFHLYFMVVLIQTLALMPLLFWKPLRAVLDGVRNWLSDGQGKPFAIGGRELAIGSLWLVLQGLIQTAQHFWLKLPFPASTCLWYSSSWFLAIVLLWPRPRATVRNLADSRSWFLLIFVSIDCGRAWLAQLMGTESPPTDWFTENFVLALYVAIISVLVLKVAFQIRVLPHVGFAQVLNYLGKNSLQIYLIHPIFLVLLAASPIKRILLASHAGPAIELGCLVALTVGAVEMMKLLKIEKLLFGRTA